MSRSPVHQPVYRAALHLTQHMHTGKEEILRRLTERAGQCSRILLASDEDREGEAIAWHLQQTLNSRVPTKRAVFHEITKEAILQSFANPR